MYLIGFLLNFITASIASLVVYFLFRFYPNIAESTLMSGVSDCKDLS